MFSASLKPLGRGIEYGGAGLAVEWVILIGAADDQKRPSGKHTPPLQTHPLQVLPTVKSCRSWGSQNRRASRSVDRANPVTVVLCILREAGDEWTPLSESSSTPHEVD